MKYLRLYDLKNGEVTVIPYKERIAEEQRAESRSRMKEITEYVASIAKDALILLAELLVSISAGFIFLHFVSEKLRVIRGYDAVGSEFFMAALVAFLVFWLIEKVGGWLWTRRQ